MNNKSLLFSAAALCLCTGLWAQQSKTYKETFNVGDDAVLEINTSHADIEFETWNQDQVEIVATVTLENISDEDAEKYFENERVSIMGNSKEIEISTSTHNSWEFLVNNDFDFDFDFEPFFEAIEIPDLPEIAVLPEMPPLPPMPPIRIQSFDYSKYKEDGEKYIKEWTQEFEEGFDEEYQKEMEEWGKRVEEKAKAWEERNADRLERMEARMEERAEEMEKRAEEREKRRVEVEKRREEVRAKREEVHRKRIEKRGNAPSIFYFNSDGEGKKYEVKKTIKIKMPKSVKLKMNVRHGEVKLAANTKNINASLRYASLLASNIDGDATRIEAAYSPMVIEYWNAGNLSTKYSDKVKLVKVKDLRLNSTSSNIFIENVLNDVYIVNDLGKTQINNVDPKFSSLFVSLKNGELNAVLPKTNCNVTIVDKLSDVSYPESIKANVVKTSSGYEIQGCVNIKKDSNPTFDVNAEYSEVVIKE